MKTRKCAVTSAVLFAAAVLQARLNGQESGVSYGTDTIGAVDNSLLANTVLQPEPEPEDEEPVAPVPPRRGLFARGFLGATGPGRIQRAPNMFGDTEGGGINILESIPTGARRFKISENNSPMPAHRIFFNYNHFHNAFQQVEPDRDEHLDRFTLGVEKAWHGGIFSTEVRIPFVAGMDEVQPGLFPTVEGGQFGNMSLTFKRLLCETEYSATSIGLGVTLPTGPDNELGNITVRNDAVHLHPFVGWLFTPNDSHFFTAFAQFDFDTNGNRVEGTGGGTRIQEQALMFFDAKAGWWVYQNPCACYITGAAPFIELHYTQTLQDEDAFGGLGHGFGAVNVLNITGGLHLLVCTNWEVTVAAVAPLRDEEEHLFDAEIGVQINRFF